MRWLSLALLLALLGATPAAATAAEVSMMGGFFAPDAVAVAPGETVTWTNDDQVAHTVTSSWDDGASFDVVLRPGESFSWTFEEAGEYAVHCRPHAHAGEGGGYEGMAMEVRVQAASAAPGGDASEGVPTGIAVGGLALIGLGAMLAWTTRRRQPTRP